MSFDFIQMPCKHWRNEDDCFSWRLLVFTIHGDKKPSLTVGRHSSCDFKLNPSEYPYFVSRTHAKFAVKEEKLYVKDLGSKNGTYINNVMLSSHIEYPLKSGDLIAFGCMSEEKPYPGKYVNQQYTPFLFRIVKVKDTKKEISLQWKTNQDHCYEEPNENLNSTLPIARNETVRRIESDEADSGIGETSSCFSNSSTKILTGDISASLNENSFRSAIDESAGLLDAVSSYTHQISSNGDPKETCLMTCSKEKSSVEDDPTVNKKRKLSLVKSTRKKLNTGLPRALKDYSVSSKAQSKQDSDSEVIEECASFECKIYSIDDDDVITWVQCDACDKWFHTVCVGCKYDEVKHRTQQFHCGFCSDPDST